MYPGLTFLVIGIIVGIYGYSKPIPQIAAIWENNLSMLKKIVPTTKQEKEMFDIAVSTTEAAKKGWIGFVENKIISTSVFFLFVGSSLLGTYFLEKRYKLLIEKIEAPNQGVQRDAGSAGAPDV